MKLCYVMLRCFSFTIIIGLAILSGCSNTQVAGSISETTNGKVVGVVVDQQGFPAGRTSVVLLPANYDPVKSSGVVSVATTDAMGNYDFSEIAPGNYTIIANSVDKKTSVLIYGIHIENRIDTIATVTLKPTGSIKVKLPADADFVNGYVYIPGSTIFASLSNVSDYVILDAVPASLIKVVSYASKTTFAATDIRYNVRVTSGSTSTVWNPALKYAQKLFLNTSETGANVNENITEFPMLVKLNAENFDFSQAKVDGSDIRFTKSDGRTLPFEIARWDMGAQTAEVWVKVDTIRGNSTSQHIIMYWGNLATISESSGAAVYDSSSGFEGVWHLSETSGTIAHDASHNGFNGIYKGGLPKVVRSPSGIGQNIQRPDTDYIDIGNVLNPGMKDFTVSVWLKRRILGTQQAFLAKTNGNAPSPTYGFLLNFDYDNFPHLYMATANTTWGSDSTFDILSTVAIADTSTWHNIFFVVSRSDNALCKMYLDGVDRTGHIGGNITNISSVVNTLNLHIGTESDRNCSFSGAIGEVTVTFSTRSSDWVKLAYMNQKNDDRLVVFDKE